MGCLSENDQLSPVSRAYLASRPKSERSPLGQFLTPRVLREELVAQIQLAPKMRVLDPGVGTGEFLASCAEKCDELEMHGWDIDEHVLAVAKELVPESTLTRRSALDPWTGPLFDVVIGNPPYFEMRNLDRVTRSNFSSVISGRPNIFALFFQAGWSVLKPGGRLGYVVPPSMNNGAYFEKLRDFIGKEFAIEYLKVFTDPFLFEDAQTAVQLVVLQKGGKSLDYIADLGAISGSPRSRKIFSENPSQIGSQFLNRKTLYVAGYQAITGSVVWNNHKENLRTQSEDDCVPLIWAHNIGDSLEVTIRENHPKRPQYIKGVKPLVGPAIVVNRITGTVGGGSLRCALVPAGRNFVAENHVNVIVPRPEFKDVVPIEEVLSALRGPSINTRVRSITGNTQLSATELMYWLPLDL